MCLRVIVYSWENAFTLGVHKGIVLSNVKHKALIQRRPEWSNILSALLSGGFCITKRDVKQNLSASFLSASVYWFPCLEGFQSDAKILPWCHVNVSRMSLQMVITRFETMAYCKKKKKKIVYRANDADKMITSLSEVTEYLSTSLIEICSFLFNRCHYHE